MISVVFGVGCILVGVCLAIFGMVMADAGRTDGLGIKNSTEPMFIGVGAVLAAIGIYVTALGFVALHGGVGA